MAPVRTAEPALRELRERIDRLNREILRLVQERGGLMLEVAAVKEALGIDTYDPRREAEMMRGLTARSAGPFSPHELETVFRALFAASLELQRRTRVEREQRDGGSAPAPPHVNIVGQ